MKSLITLTQAEWFSLGLEKSCAVFTPNHPKSKIDGSVKSQNKETKWNKSSHAFPRVPPVIFTWEGRALQFLTGCMHGI